MDASWTVKTKSGAVTPAAEPVGRRTYGLERALDHLPARDAGPARPVDT